MNTTQSRWFTYVLKWVEGADGEMTEEPHLGTTFHESLDEAKEAIKHRLLSCDPDLDTIGIVERHDYDQQWHEWFTPEDAYDPMIIAKNNHNELVVLNEGMGL